MESSAAFGDIITHECTEHMSVIITKKLHEMPYHMVTNWNEVINPYLPRQLVTFNTLFHTNKCLAG